MEPTEERKDAPVIRPTNSLIDGAEVVQQVLGPRGFQFEFCGEGKGTGGAFAWGEFICGDRRLELHFRHSLGLVTYHIAYWRASHESYIQELGVLEQCLYPGFSEDPAVAFHGLAHDLAFAEDFLSGSGGALQRAAARDVLESASRNEELMASYVGDSRNLEELRDRFREGQYDKVACIAAELKYPNRMSQSELRMVQIARERAGNA